MLELLAAEESMKESMMEGAEPLIAPKASKEKKMTLKKTKLKKKDKGTKLKKKAASVARE